MRGILLSILFAGLALGLYLEHNDWPSVYHHDEPSKVAQLQRNERNFNHPLFLLEATDLVRKLAGVSLDDEVGILVCGRFVSAACMAAALGLLSLAASRRGGIVAGLMVGMVGLLCFRFYEVGHYFKEDTPYLLGLAATLCALTTEKRNALWLGLGIGLATVSKYAGVSLLLIGLYVRPERRTLCLSFLAVVVLVHLKVFFLESPFSNLLGSISQETGWLLHGHKGMGTKVPNLDYLWRLIFALGYHGLLLLGLWGVFRKELTRADLAVVCYAVAYLLVLTFSRKYSERYLLPVLMIALYYVGLQMAFLVRKAPTSRLRWCVAVALLCAVALPWYPRLASHREAFANDSRSGLCQYIATKMPPEPNIVADAAAEVEAAQAWRGEAITPIEVADYVPQLGSLSDLKARGVTHVIVCYDTYYRFLAESASVGVERQAEWKAARAFYARLKQETPLWQAPPRDPKPLHPGLELYAMPGKL